MSINKFPFKLHHMLEVTSNDSKLSNIVSWLPCGRAFRVHNLRAFTRDVLPCFFPGMKDQRSFRRQLNLYGIRQRVVLLESGRDGTAANAGPLVNLVVEDHDCKWGVQQQQRQQQQTVIGGAYCHPLIHRDHPNRCSLLRREPRKFKKNKARAIIITTKKEGSSLVSKSSSSFSNKTTLAKVSTRSSNYHTAQPKDFRFTEEEIRHEIIRTFR